MTCLSPSNFKLIYLIQFCAQKNEFYKLCMKILMSLQSTNKSKRSYLFKLWFKILIFFFYAHRYYFCSCKSYHIGIFFNIILIENRKNSEYMKLWRGRIVCLGFYKLCSYFLIRRFLFLCSLSLKDSVMIDSHSLVSRKKELSGFSSLVLSCLLKSSSWQRIRIVHE